MKERSCVMKERKLCDEGAKFRVFSEFSGFLRVFEGFLIPSPPIKLRVFPSCVMKEDELCDEGG